MLPLIGPFRCNVSIYDPWVPEAVIEESGCRPATLEDVLSNSRFIFVFAGVTKENQGFLDEKMLKLIGRDANFLLMSRAAVVDFNALNELTLAGRFRAAVDVFPEEPMPADHSVRNNENMILSPHRAGGIPQAFAQIGRMVIDDLQLILRGLPPVRMQEAQRETVKRFASKPAG
jgi:phosphoglycerate dehydrogenase-like enzyme